MLTHHEKYRDDADNLGYQERLRHVELVRGGAPCYLVMCEAEDVDAVPRKIKTFNEREVFMTGALVEHDGDTWIEFKGRVPVGDVTPPK